jgi:hypothetical protein
MMEAIYRNAASVSRAGSPPTRSGTGTLSGLWSDVFGGSTQPAYKQGTRIASSAEEARCWWRPFAATPQYRTVPADDRDEGGQMPPECVEEDVLVDIGECEPICW